MASGNSPPQGREVVVRGDGNCFCRAIALWNDEVSSEKHEEIRRLRSGLIERDLKVFEPLLFSPNSVEDHVKNCKITELELKLWTSSAVHCSLSDLFALSHRRRKNGRPLSRLRTLIRLYPSQKRINCRCPIPSKYHDEYTQANHSNLLLPKSSCCRAPLLENSASSVSIALEKNGNLYAKAVKQTT